MDKIRIKLRAFDHRVLDEAARKIAEVVKESGSKISGPIPLPTRREVFCVLRSPHIDKRSMEHFEMRTHKRLLDIHKPTPRTIEEIRALNLPSEVDIEIKT